MISFAAAEVSRNIIVGGPEIRTVSSLVYGSFGARVHFLHFVQNSQE